MRLNAFSHVVPTQMFSPVQLVGSLGLHVCEGASAWERGASRCAGGASTMAGVEPPPQAAKATKLHAMRCFMPPSSERSHFVAALFMRHRARGSYLVANAGLRTRRSVSHRAAARRG